MPITDPFSSLSRHNRAVLLSSTEHTDMFCTFVGNVESLEVDVKVWRMTIRMGLNMLLLPGDAISGLL